jgi:hypothetical protein
VTISARQRPVVARIDDTLDILHATAKALEDNAYDHADHLCHRQLVAWTQRLADIQGTLDRCAIGPFNPPADPH